MVALNSNRFNFERDFVPYWNAIWFCFGLTFLAAISQPLIGYHAIGLLFLAGIAAVGRISTVRVVFFTAGLSAFCWDFFFIPPRFRFSISSSEDVALCMTYFVVALLTGLWRKRNHDRKLSHTSSDSLVGRSTRQLVWANRIDGIRPIGPEADLQSISCSGVLFRAFERLGPSVGNANWNFSIETGATDIKVDRPLAESAFVSLLKLLSTFKTGARPAISLLFAPGDDSRVVLTAEVDRPVDVSAEALQDLRVAHARFDAVLTPLYRSDGQVHGQAHGFKIIFTSS